MMGYLKIKMETTNSDIQQNRDLILSIWKKASEFQKNKIEKLCKKYKVDKKIIEVDEGWTKYRFTESKVEFSIPNGDNYEDFDLTGNALKFAEKHNEIINETLSIVDNELKKKGFERYDQDEGYETFIKDNIEYSVSYYADKEEHITILQEGGLNSSLGIRNGRII